MAKSDLRYDKTLLRELSETYEVVPLNRGEERREILLAGRELTGAEREHLQKIYGEEEDLLFIQDKRYNLEKVQEEYYDICRENKSYRETFLQIYEEGSMEAILLFCLNVAVELNASDIHLVSEREIFRVKLRIDGLLRTLFSARGSFGDQLVRYIKVRSKIDISRTFTPLEGRFTQALKEENLDIRVSIMPTVIGEKLSLRILGIGRNLFHMEDIGFTSQEQQLLRRYLGRSAGFILVTGPTGSGKSTTLMTLLREINDGKRNIISIEDPVEYQVDGVTQVSLSKEVASDFYDILKFTLRQDPDVIMIGEIRDEKTADTGLKSAITGHLVLSSIHTKSSVGAIDRLMDLDVPNYVIADSLSLVINQRLVRILCPACKEEYQEEERVLDFLGEKSGKKCYRAKGCPGCYGTGYAGRKAVFEILEIAEEDRRAIKASETGEINKKLISLQEKIKSMVWKGTTSIDEYLKYF